MAIMECFWSRIRSATQWLFQIVNYFLPNSVESTDPFYYTVPRTHRHGERQPPPAVASVVVSKVFDSEDLLIEILLRVGFPTTLVRAALVCRRWLWHVSQPVFLRRFRELHPPRLLGFYLNTSRPGSWCPFFVPMLPQPPVLATAVNHVRVCPDTWRHAPMDIMNCLNGRVFTRQRQGVGFRYRVYRPLCAADRAMTAVPRFPRYRFQPGSFDIWHDLLSKEQGDGDLSFFYVLIESTKKVTKFTAHVYMLQDGVWCTRNTLATDQPFLPLGQPKPVLVDNKIYIAADQRKIIVLDLTVSSFSTIPLPQGVVYGDRDTMLSPADDASSVSVYLIQVKELQLCIWLHKCGDNWLLVDTICLREMCAKLRMSDSVLLIKQVGDNAEFVFFQMGRWVLYLDIKCRTLRKVYDMRKDEYRSHLHICPFKMIWPPRFPAPKDDLSRNAM